MPKLTNTTLLVTYLIVIGLAGTYFTFYQQGSQISKLDEEISEKRERKKRVTDLKEKIKKAKSSLKMKRRRWRKRYKTVPDTMSSIDLSAFIRDATRQGFSNVNIRGYRSTTKESYKTHSFQVEGRTTYSSLYRTVWEIENSPRLFQVSELRVNRERKEEKGDEEEKSASMSIVVTFSMRVKGFYGLAPPVSKPPSDGRTGEPRRLPNLNVSEALSLPERFRPTALLSGNPFYPVVLSKVPPNTENRVDIEAANLLSLSESSVSVRWDGERVQLSEGDRVYLGRVSNIDPKAGTITARLNRGGIIDLVTRKVWSGNEENKGSDVISEN